MTRTLLATLTALLVLAAPAAAAKKTFTIRGAGFGHGVGMSQYGAMGYATHGWNAAQILGHYYTGTVLGTTDPARKLRIRLVEETSSVRISGARQAGSRKLDPTVSYTLSRRGVSQVQLSANGKRLATFTAPLQVAGANGIVAVSGKGAYRGTMEFKPTLFKGLSVTNVVALEDYLNGVVPVESPASWPAEALKAQAIAARTYAITTAKSADFDHYADTRSQVYGGVSVEAASTNAAVAATRGQVVTYQGQPVVTYFFSTSGGRTEAVENTTLGTEPKPWLKSVEDEYDHVSPRHRWSTRPSMASAGKKLRGLYSGAFRGIRVLRRGESPRIVEAEVVGSRGSTRVNGATLRQKLELFDTWAYFTTISGSAKSSDPSGGAQAPRPIAMASLAAVGELRGTVLGDGSSGTVQVRRGGRWIDLGTVRIGRSGAYRWTVYGRRAYRLVVDGAVGPTVRF
jgi:stage II sporulation protein D